MNIYQNNQQLEQIIGLRLKLADCNIKLGQINTLKQTINHQSNIIASKNQQIQKINRKMDEVIQFHRQIQQMIKIQPNNQHLSILQQITNLLRNNQQLKQSNCQLIVGLQTQKKKCMDAEHRIYQIMRVLHDKQNQIKSKQQQLKSMNYKIHQLQQKLLIFEQDSNLINKQIKQYAVQNQQLRQQLSKNMQSNIKVQRVDYLKKQCYELLNAIDVKSDQYLKSYFQKEGNYVQDYQTLSKKSKYDFLFSD